ncbi:hypothetical protein Pmani_007371 [Petrolisthes manimaculis]|uniref:Fibronectin type-III domain-containing protein n=1 Tax=Petrolisthes manimaculis TaxID=1843537 RepID=A0AAE1Q8W5_9EUCA|nr:hypothetical protein Pmani_007371 [Petrolisthes manimaculis]
MFIEQMSSNLEEKPSSATERLREEYRKHVQTQISHDLVDTIASLEQHQEQLQQLRDQLSLAKTQVTNSASETKQAVNKVFDTFLSTLTETVNVRRQQLLEEVEQVEEEAVSPLDQCAGVVVARVRETMERVEQGRRLQKHPGVLAKDTVIRFQEEAAAMTSLPEVPALCAVASVSVEFPSNPTLTQEVQELVKEAGRVSRIGPVQITNIVEQPGSLLVSWEEVDEDVSDDGIEFCLEFSHSAAANHHSASFHTVYVGPDYSFLVRDLKAGEPYLLRVASRREGSSSFGPWSLVQSAVTNISHFKWKQGTGGWSVADDGRLASKITNDVDVLHSDGPLLKAGSSVLFKVMSGGGGISDEGVGLSCQPVTGPEQLLLTGTLFLSAQGCVFLDGVSRVTRLPAIQDKSQVSFAVEKVSSSKVRVYIESQEKQVTYEWSVPNASEGLYFVATFNEPRWKISVH